MNKKIIYPVTIEKLEKVKGDYIILQGGRSTGKSYSVKYKMLRDAFASIVDGVCSCRFIYLRRYTDEAKDVFSQSYFEDIDINVLTNCMYNAVIVYRHEIYFGNIDTEGNATRAVLIGRVCALSNQGKYKSQVFKDYKYIVFEEFINDMYITNEPTKLFNFASTVFRNDKGVCYMIGNLISRYNPYFREWELTNALAQDIDTIDTYKVDNVIVKCWKCPNGISNKMVFGHAKKAVDGVEYETKQQPHLQCDREECQLIYTVVLEHDGFKYLCEFLRHNNNMFWFIQPKTSDIQARTRVISKTFNPNPLYTRTFEGLTPAEASAFRMLKNGKVCFSDNLTGTEFSHIINEY